MITTEFCNFDGDLWQRICKICFLRKYEEEQYIEIVASPGDFGLEGFTKTGKAFQCYCPDDSYSADELYEKQRRKITTDLGKLKFNEKPLSDRLGSTLIHTWYFVTPAYRKNEIVAHCAKKEKEVKAWRLSIIDSDKFSIVPVDIDFLHPFLKSAIDGTGTKLRLRSDVIDSESIVKYEEDADYLVENAKKKHAKRIARAGDTSTTVNDLTHRTIKSFLEGSSILAKFRDIIPDDFEKFVRIVQQESDDVIDLCLSPSNDHNKRYIDVKRHVENKIKTSFPGLDEPTIKDLSNYVVADWILRCPLSFNDDKD